MIVAELIEALRKLPQHVQVKVTDGYNYWCDPGAIRQVDANCDENEYLERGTVLIPGNKEW